MIEVFFLALALSMDAFAVSIGLGANRNTPGVAVKAGFFFGFSQALMPLIGYLGGKTVLGWMQSYTHWLAFIVLVAIGAKMIYEGFRNNQVDDIPAVTGKVMLTLAIATSIDATAAGFTLSLFKLNPYVACLLIGVTTFCFSMLGVFIGKRSGTWLESKAEFFGGGVLILLGFKFLIF
jgi:manganese efflux pump family protein